MSKEKPLLKEKSVDIDYSIKQIQYLLASFFLVLKTVVIYLGIQVAIGLEIRASEMQ